MKLRSFAVAVLAAGLVSMPHAHAADAPADACAANVTASLEALARGDYVAAGAHFGARIAGKVDANRLRQAWTQIQGAAGAYQKHEAARQAPGNASAVAVPIAFAKAPLALVAHCDEHGAIVGYQFVPASAAARLLNSQPAQAVTAHVEADGVRVQPMAVASPSGPLKGVLTLPAGKGPFPAVVMVAGSGAHDFDETVGPNKPFRDIAEGLAKMGVASLRYDKRPYDYSDWGDKSGYTIDAEVTDDAVTAARALAGQKAIDPHRIYVLGHSLGAMMAPRIGQRDPQLAGLVLMAAPARTLLDVLAQQFRDQEPRKVARRNIEAIRNEQKLLAHARPGQPPQGTFMHQPQSYWLSLNDYHQVDVARSLAMPMLFLQGDADFQVSPTLDFASWKRDMAGKPEAAFHLYPGLSHLFMPADQTGDDYSKPSHVDPRVIRDIAAWIGQR
jgi:pimeloyl-ACP methyl ester carboxylesterase